MDSCTIFHRFLTPQEQDKFTHMKGVIPFIANQNFAKIVEKVGQPTKPITSIPPE